METYCHILTKTQNFFYIGAFSGKNQAVEVVSASSRPLRESLRRPRLRLLTSEAREGGRGVIILRVPSCQGEGSSNPRAIARRAPSQRPMSVCSRGGR